MRWLALVLTLVPSVAYGQRVGSAEAYSTMYDHKMRQMESEAQWNVAKKLYVGRLPADLKPPTSTGMDPDAMTEGQIGKLDYWAFKIWMVIDDKNCILSLGSRSLWLADFPTKDLVDDLSVRLVTPVKVGETKSHLGRTMRVVRFVSAEELAEHEAEGQRRKEAIRLAAEEAEYTKWTSTAGTTIEARFVEWKAGKIELQTRDGKSFFVTTSQLVPEDAEKARKIFKDLRAKK